MSPPNSSRPLSGSTNFYRELRPIILAMSLMVLVLVLAACSIPAGNTLKEQESPTVSPALEEKIRIRWAVGLGKSMDPQQVEILQAMVDNFNASHDDIELELDLLPYESARQMLAAQIEADDGPDIVGPVVTREANVFYDQWLDLRPWLEVANYDMSAFNPSLETFYQTDDELLGLPFVVYPSAMYYQKTMFDQAGLNYPPQNLGDPYVWPDGTEEEWSWSTVANVARMLTLDVNGLTPLDQGFDRTQIVQTGYHPQWQHASIMATFFEAGQIYAGEPGAYTTAFPEAWKEAWRWWFDGICGDQPFIAGSSLADSAEFGGGNVFNSGRTAMAVTQFWYTCCLENAGQAWDLAALPSYNGIVHGRLDEETFRIWKGTKNPAAALEVLFYLVSPEGVQPLLLGDQDTPAGDSTAFPALTEFQVAFVAAKAEQFPFVENWDIFMQSLNYPDIPSAEGWMPNYNKSWERIGDFGDLIQSDCGIDFDAELETLEADLEMIFNE